MADVIRQHIEQSAKGAHVAGSRIRVQDVAVWHEKLGMSPDEIVDQHPTLSLADVHAAMAHYWDNCEAIDRSIAEERAFAERLQQQAPGPLQEKLRALGRG